MLKYSLMKKLFLLIIPFMLLAACNQSSPTDPSGPSEPPSGEVDPPSGEVDPPSGDEDDPEVDPVEQTNLKGLKLNYSSYVFDANDLNKKKNIFYVDYEPSTGLTEEEKEVYWYSTDTSVFEISEITGGITPRSYGSAYAVVASKIGNIKDRCLISVVEDKNNVQYEYQLVTDVASLKNKDTIVFASPSKGKTATLDTTGSYLHTVSSSFSSDKTRITSLGEGTAEFYVGEEENGFSLEGQNGKYFVGFNLARVGFVNKTGNYEWRFTIDSEDNELYIETYNDVRGWLMFNEALDNGNGGFTLYESSVQIDLYMPTIYRLTIVK